MKYLYQCELCNAQYDSYEAAEECEKSHRQKLCDRFDQELRKRYQFKPGQAMPTEVTLATMTEVYDEEKGEWKYVYDFGLYQLKKQLPQDQADQIVKETTDREQAEEEATRRWRAEREAREAQKKAEEEAAQAAEQTTEDVGE